MDSLIDCLRLHAARHPAAPAFTFLKDLASEETMSCGELWRRVVNASAQIQEITSAGDRVLVANPPGVDFIVSMFACLHAGVVAVPTYPPAMSQRHDRFSSVAADCDAFLAIGKDPTNLASVCEAAPEGLRALRWLTTNAHTENHTAPIRPSNGELALLQYTSGSTGRPKGVMLTSANLMANIRAITHQFCASAEDRAVFWLPPYHDMGLIGAVFASVVHRIHTILLPPSSFLRHPFRWLEVIDRFQATITGAPSFAYVLCNRRIQDHQLGQLHLNSLNIAFCGSEPIDVGGIRRFAERFSRCGFNARAIYPCYGLAEATLMVSGPSRGAGMNVRRMDSREIAGCGHAPPEHDIQIVDPETCKAVPMGSVGEIWFRGPSVARGYWNKETETQETFQARIANGSNSGEMYLRTGDLGFVVPDSVDPNKHELFVTGRIKDLIIVAGRNIHPEDLETIASESHALLAERRAVAFGVDEGVVLVQEVDRKLVKDDLAAAKQAVMRALFESNGISPYRIMFVLPNSIPLTTSGKVMRNACRQQFEKGTLQEMAEVVNE